MGKSDRRAFLKFSTLAVASSAASSSLRALAAGNPVGATQIKAWRTSGHQRFDPIDAPAWQAGVEVSSVNIRLDPNQRYQQMLGFGAALTDATCYLLEQIDAQKRKAILDECFGTSGLRFSVAALRLDPAIILSAPIAMTRRLRPIPISRISVLSTTAHSSCLYFGRRARLIPISSIFPRRGVRRDG